MACLALFSVSFLGEFSLAQAKNSSSPSAETKVATDTAKLNEIFKTILDPGALEVGDSLISPGSSLYFLKAIREKIELYFSSNYQVQTQRELEFSVRRLREVKTLIEEGREDLIEETLQKYRNHLDEVQKLDNGGRSMHINVGASIARHMYVLQSLYYNINEVEAKRAVRTSIQRVLEHNWNLLGSKELEVGEKQDLSDQIALRQIAGCKFLNEETKNTAFNESEREILKEYVSDCQTKIRENFKEQIIQIETTK